MRNLAEWARISRNWNMLSTLLSKLPSILSLNPLLMLLDEDIRNDDVVLWTGDARSIFDEPNA
jgi:hypothetical protein